MILCLADAEDESADLLDAGDHQQHRDELALTEGLRKLQALRDAERDGDRHQQIMHHRGQTETVGPQGSEEAQLADQAEPAVPAEGVLLVGVQQGNEAVPAWLARLAEKTPSADDEKQAAQYNIAEEVGQDGDGLLGFQGLAVVICGEEGVDLLFKVAGIDKRADLDEADIAVLVDKDGGGEAGNLEEAQRVARKTHREGEGVAVLVLGDDVHRVFRVAGDGDNDHAVLVCLVDGLHVGKFMFTGAAPACKDIENDQILFLQQL